MPKKVNKKVSSESIVIRLRVTFHSGCVADLTCNDPFPARLVAMVLQDDGCTVELSADPPDHPDAEVLRRIVDGEFDYLDEEV